MRTRTTLDAGRSKEGIDRRTATLTARQQQAPSVGRSWPDFAAANCDACG